MRFPQRPSPEELPSGGRVPSILDHRCDCVTLRNKRRGGLRRPRRSRVLGREQGSCRDGQGHPGGFTRLCQQLSKA